MTGGSSEALRECCRRAGLRGGRHRHRRFHPSARYLLWSGWTQANLRPGERAGRGALGTIVRSRGPITGSVYDAALMLQVIAGYDAGDPASVDAPIPDFLAAIAQLPPGCASAYRELTSSTICTLK